MKKIRRTFAVLMAMAILMTGVPFSIAEEAETSETAVVQIEEPTAAPTPEPTPEPTAEPTPEPTPEPTAEPTPEPTAEPTVEVTAEPTVEATAEPTPEPAADPTDKRLPETAQELAACFGLKLSEIAEALDMTEDELLAMSADEIAALYARVQELLSEAAPLETGDFVIENGVLMQYCGTDSSVVIPEEVVRIGARAFEGNTSIRSVSVPNRVTSIGEAAFMGCANLSDVSLGSGLQEMGDFAFAESGVKSVTIPRKMKTIPAGAFYNCTSLAVLEISEGVTEAKCGSISGYAADCGAFMNCTALKRVSLPDTMKLLGRNMFKGCTALTEITIPASVTSIGDGTFDGCGKVTVWVYENSPAHEYCKANYSGSWSLIGDVQNIADSGESSIVMPAYAPELPAETLRVEGKDTLIKGASTDLKVYNASGVKLSNRRLTWSSSDTGVATVSGGRVTGRAPGSAVITAVDSEGVHGTFNVEVVPAPQSVSLHLEGRELKNNETITMNLEETALLKAVVSPADADPTISWTSSNSKLVGLGEHDPDGRDAQVELRALKETSAVTITAKTSNGKSVKVKIKVVDPYKPTAVKLDQTGTVNLNLGETLTLTPILAPETAEATYSWKTSAAKIATVADGVVVPVGEGTATITVTAVRGSVKKTATVKVKVVDPCKPTGVKLDQTGTVNLNLGETLTLTPILAPETAEATYSWKTSAAKIATVADGVVVPVGEGTATITVTAVRGSVKKTATVKVKVVDPCKPTGIALDQSGTVTLYMGSVLELNATLQPVDATRMLSWTSSSTRVATVDANGVVTPIKEGTVTITVKTHNGKSDTVKVKVANPPAPTSVALDQIGAVTLDLGSSLTLNAEVQPANAIRNLTWTSSDTGVATVDANGVVASVAEGAAVITVTTHNGKSASVTVQVVKVEVPVDSGSCGSNVTWELNTEGALKIKGSGEMMDCSASSAPWSSYRDSITSVVIEDGVSGIGERSFENCTGLTSIRIPDSVTSIGAYAFSGCSALTSVNVPDSVTRIDDGVFMNCSSLASIDLPDSVTVIGYRAFYACKSLKRMN